MDDLDGESACTFAAGQSRTVYPESENVPGGSSLRVH